MITLQLQTPVAASRVRHHGKHHWHAPGYAAWLEHARWIARSAAHAPLAGPICLAVVVVVARPQDRPKWATKEAWKAGCRLWRPIKPDDDNFGKAIRDALNHWVIVDDGQIVSSLAYKVAAREREDPKILVWVGPVQEETEIFSECRTALGRVE
jgi:Holliday junction resolvase RusA-like endonuclease